MSYRLNSLKEYGRNEARELSKQDLAITRPGSISYLLFGAKPSRQSIVIKFGHVGEKLTRKMINDSESLKLLPCGFHKVDGKKKDIDLLWEDHNKKIIYYREAKGNIEMDTEKIPAMIYKINAEVKGYIANKYPGHKIDIGILNWSVYDRKSITVGKAHIKKCEKQDIKVDHMKEFLTQVNLDWSEEDFYGYFKELGEILEPDRDIIIENQVQVQGMVQLRQAPVQVEPAPTHHQVSPFQVPVRVPVQVPVRVQDCIQPNPLNQTAM
jgi:hypothetical protein